MKARSRYLSVFIVIILALTLFAPNSALAASPITVKPTALNGWAFLLETGASGNGDFMSGPAMAPLGNGSVHFTTGSNTDGILIGMNGYAGTKLSDITSLEYSTYQDAGSTSTVQVVSLQFNIDNDVTDADTGWKGRLIFEPYYTETIVNGSWQTWTPKTQGKWWGSHASISGTCSMGSPCTWTQLLATFPNIGIHPTVGAVMFKAGSGWPAGFNGNVDALTIGISGTDTTYDFEPTPPDNDGPLTSNVLASSNPAAINSSVTATANVDDTTTGGSDIASAEYSLDNGMSWSPMAAADGGFDGVGEDVTVVFSAPAAGVYDLCVRGADTAGNVGGKECTMFVAYDPSGGFVTGGGWIDSPAGAVAPVENIVYFNGFEADIEGWFTPTRVMSGNNGIPSASGGYHAEALRDFTRWGGYSSVFPAGGFFTSIDVYLDIERGYANDTRFDWTSAINAPDGNHRRDFMFNGGFYNDATGPGAGLNRFVFSASNNAPGWPKNPGRNPIAVTQTGWYTLQHHFYDNGAGILAVDLSILDGAGNVIHTWTLSDPTDVIGVTVGGNRYGWFAVNNFPFLAIDNSVRKEFSDLTGKATFGFVSKYKRGATVPDGNTEFKFVAGDLNFSSTSYQWLVVNQAGTNAQFKGSGTINGTGNYGFMLWAGDGSPDTFRIKIWETGTEVVVYDNGTDQPIGGGSIVIHKK